jgi:hypothetical protein
MLCKKRPSLGEPVPGAMYDHKKIEINSRRRDCGRRFCLRHINFSLRPATTKSARNARPDIDSGDSPTGLGPDNVEPTPAELPERCG